MKCVGNGLDRFLARPPAPLAPPPGEEQSIAVEIGRFQIDSLLGEGAMGAVSLGHRADAEFRQQVAIKLVRSGLHSPEAYRRFRRERHVLADLEHPNVARLLDGGTTPDGRPYLVMEHVGGEPIKIAAEISGEPVGQPVEGTTPDSETGRVLFEYADRRGG